VLSAAELAAMRSTAGDALPGTAVLHRSTQSTDALGGRTDLWAAYGTVTCRVSPSTSMSDGEEIYGGEWHNAMPYIITLPYGTDVTSSDRVVANGQTFEVLAEDTDRDWGLSTRLTCRLVS
jgi:head-tail adaptor